MSAQRVVCDWSMIYIINDRNINTVKNMLTQEAKLKFELNVTPRQALRVCLLRIFRASRLIIFKLISSARLNAQYLDPAIIIIDGFDSINIQTNHVCLRFEFFINPDCVIYRVFFIGVIACLY